MQQIKIKLATDRVYTELHSFYISCIKTDGVDLLLKKENQLIFE